MRIFYDTEYAALLKPVGCVCREGARGVRGPVGVARQSGFGVSIGEVARTLRRSASRLIPVSRTTPPDSDSYNNHHHRGSQRYANAYQQRDQRGSHTPECMNPFQRNEVR